MGMWGHYSIGEQIAAEYNISSHGDLHATYESISNADVPSYAHGFYSPTSHEAISEIVYQRTEIGYDKGMRDMQKALQGPDIEEYIPRGAIDDGSSSAVRTGVDVIEPVIVKNPPKEIVNEILKAQEMVKARDFKIEEIEIEEIIIKRRMKKRRITFDRENA